MARIYKQMMHQAMNNMCQMNEEVLCNVFGTTYRDKAFGIFPGKVAEMFAGITSHGKPNFLGINRVQITFNMNGKKKCVDLNVASDVENSDLDEQAKNVSRFLLELRRITKLY